MKKCLSLTVILFVSGFLIVLGQDNTWIINADQLQNKISKHICGQLSEHPGTDIYDSIWVGDDSEIPNTEGYRTDVLNVLQNL